VADALAFAGHDVLVAETTMSTPSDVDHVSGWVEELLAPPVPDDGRPVVVVGHSAACPRLPLAASALRGAGWPVIAFICVDGRFPDGRPFTVSGPQLGEMLDGIVRPDDHVPPWPRWWGSLVEGLVLDPVARVEVFREARPIPRAWFDQGCPVPELPPQIGRGFLAFGLGYSESCERAAAEGWIIHRMAGDHLHQIVEPEAVAEALQAMAECLGSHSQGFSG
jgi:hypothetical protein